jgi:hypothetical protein
MSANELMRKLGHLIVIISNVANIVIFWSRWWANLELQPACTEMFINLSHCPVSPTILWALYVNYESDE